MAKERIIHQAEFSKNVCKYWLISGSMTCILTIVGIPFLLLWIPLGLYFTKRYLKSMDCTLTNKALKVKKGIMVKTEKTIPLEKITDLGMKQGPIMRAMGLQTLTVETAGQSGPTGALVSLTGIVDAEAFRELVLEQRDAEKDNNDPYAAQADSAAAPATDLHALKTILTEIRDTLQRIEQQGK